LGGRRRKEKSEEGRGEGELRVRRKRESMVWYTYVLRAQEGPFRGLQRSPRLLLSV
jgi:hypothetical protein